MNTLLKKLYREQRKNRLFYANYPIKWTVCLPDPEGYVTVIVQKDKSFKIKLYECTN